MLYVPPSLSFSGFLGYAGGPGNILGTHAIVLYIPLRWVSQDSWDSQEDILGYRYTCYRAVCTPSLSISGFLGYAGGPGNVLCGTCTCAVDAASNP